MIKRADVEREVQRQLELHSLTDFVKSANFYVDVLYIEEHETELDDVLASRLALVMHSVSVAVARQLPEELREEFLDRLAFARIVTDSEADGAEGEAN